MLLGAYRAIVEAIRDERAITPAAEWLVDNFHIVEDQIREIRDDLPRGFYRQLPKLATGPLAGYPRVFGLAWAFVAHTDSRFDPQMLRRFVRRLPARAAAHASVSCGRSRSRCASCWSENLRRAAERIVIDRAARARGRPLADRLLGADGREPEPATTALRRFEQAPLSTAFAVQLVQRLRDQDPGRDARAPVARRAAGGPGHDRRRDGSRRAPAARAR